MKVQEQMQYSSARIQALSEGDFRVLIMQQVLSLELQTGVGTADGGSR